MNIFRKIAKIIERYIPYIKWGKNTNVVTFQDVQPKILKIEQKQKVEREQVLAKETKILQKRITTLKPTQTKLIEQKSKIQNIINSDQELEIFINLNNQIELLESNLILQRQIDLIIKTIDTEQLAIISKKITSEEHIKDLIPELEIIKKTKKTEREKEGREIRELKNKTLKFSLVQIHKVREEKRIEKERIEREQKLEEQFVKYISNSEKALTNFEFEQATIELNSALTVRPERDKEVQPLLENVSKIETDYKNRKSEFEELFNTAENYFHNNELGKAIEKYKEAKLLNVDNLICKRRISDTENKIQRIKQRVEKQRQKAKDEKEKREKYKVDADEIIAFYRQNGVSNFYHYTDTRNLNSILQNNGLFSLNEMNNKGIDYLQGSETYEKADYVRLSYTQNHPLLYVSKQQGRIRQEETLEISLDVAGLKYTKFTNVNAARTATAPTVKIGDDLNYIKNQVRIGIVMQRNHFDLSDEEKPYYQAEVMVKDHLPLEYIMNLEN